MAAALDIYTMILSSLVYFQLVLLKNRGDLPRSFLSTNGQMAYERRFTPAQFGVSGFETTVMAKARYLQCLSTSMYLTGFIAHHDSVSWVC